MKHYEVNFDGLVGPTHNYAGLSYGNVASASNANQVSNPKQAALEGLAKMKTLSELGLKQGVLAPQERPDLSTLRQLGFCGPDSQVLERAYQQTPELLAACSSASSMWTANAATVSPSADTRDGKVHFTPANLTSKFHRAIEPQTTGRLLRATFADPDYFCHHSHLPENDHFGDEGAANHTRLCSAYGHAGVELFVFGRYAFRSGQPAPRKYPARQTYEASAAVARLHGLEAESLVLAQQNPRVIDQGVFHNDVIAVGNQNVLFYHQQAFLNTQALKDELLQKFPKDSPLHFIEVSDDQVSVHDAVQSYLFNTQIVTLNPQDSGDPQMAIIAPAECQERPAVHNYLQQLVQQDTPIRQVRYIDVKQSMQNGGGPACLRLRVALSEAELAAVNPQTLLTDNLYQRLTNWVERHYRDRLAADDLRDPNLLQESRSALDELTQILDLGSVYSFQRDTL